MENNTNPILETPIITQPEFVLPPPKKNYLTIFLILLVFILFITCIYLLFKQSSAVTPDSTLQTPTQTPVAVLPLVTSIQTPEPSVFSTTKTFTDANKQYSFNYPSTYKILTSIPELFNGTMLDVRANCRGPILQNVTDPRVLIVMEIVPADGDGGFCWSNGIFSKDDKWSSDDSGWKGTYFVMDEVKTTNTQFLGFIGLVNKETYTLKGQEAFTQILSTFKFTESKATSLGNWTKQTDNHFKTNNNCLWILTAKESYSGNLSSFVSKFYGNTPIEKLLDPTQYQVRDTQTITTSAQGVGELFTIFFDKNNSKHAIIFSVTSQDDVLSKPQCKNYLTDVDYILNNIDFFI